MIGTTINLAPWAFAMLAMGGPIAGGLLVFGACTWHYHKGVEDTEEDAARQIADIHAVAEPPDYLPMAEDIAAACREISRPWVIDGEQIPFGGWQPSEEEVTRALEQFRLGTAYESQHAR